MPSDGPGAELGAGLAPGLVGGGAGTPRFATGSGGVGLPGDLRCGTGGALESFDKSEGVEDVLSACPGRFGAGFVGLDGGLALDGRSGGPEGGVLDGICGGAPLGGGPLVGSPGGGPLDDVGGAPPDDVGGGPPDDVGGAPPDVLPICRLLISSIIGLPLGTNPPPPEGLPPDEGFAPPASDLGESGRLICDGSTFLSAVPFRIAFIKSSRPVDFACCFKSFTEGFSGGGGGGGGGGIVST